MSYFAHVNAMGIVDKVIVADSLFISRLPDSASWVQTEKGMLGGVNTKGGPVMRKNYAGIGFNYDPVRDAFVPPKPFDSWSLNEETCLWDPPTPRPEDGNRYRWNEATTSWDLVVEAGNTD